MPTITRKITEMRKSIPESKKEGRCIYAAAENVNKALSDDQKLAAPQAQITLKAMENPQVFPALTNKNPNEVSEKNNFESENEFAIVAGSGNRIFAPGGIRVIASTIPLAHHTTPSQLIIICVIAPSRLILYSKVGHTTYDLFICLVDPFTFYSQIISTKNLKVPGSTAGIYTSVNLDSRTRWQPASRVPSFEISVPWDNIVNPPDYSLTSKVLFARYLHIKMMKQWSWGEEQRMDDFGTWKKCKEFVEEYSNVGGHTLPPFISQCQPQQPDIRQGHAY
ncbi:hypothetical protein EDB19DRAFT_2023134 [Suillus lakei]|nr:hypothetical protein EDB19DRAFT_2023134 [Suillus lakei]